MQVQIKGTNLKLTPAIKEYIETKMEMLAKYLGDIKVSNCDFEVELTTHHHHKGDIFRAEVNLVVPGHSIFIEKTEADLYKAIDKVKDHLVQGIKKYKETKVLNHA